jgi:hypothetical protein
VSFGVEHARPEYQMLNAPQPLNKDSCMQVPGHDGILVSTGDLDAAKKIF